MKVRLTPSHLTGTIAAPASKSAMQRACAAALIRNGETILHNPGISNDDKAALNIIQQLGATVIERDNDIVIKSNGVQPVSDTIDCHESGLSIRMFTSIAALSHHPITVIGSGSLAKRPMNFFDDVLPQLGVDCKSHNGYLPLNIQGPLQPKNITVDGSLSSQYLTGLLMAYAAADAKEVTINVTDLNSRPYVDLTLQVLQSFGLKVPQNNNYGSFYFDAATTNRSTTINYTVEGDWSNAAFLLVAGAIAGDITIQGMDMHSVQGDKAIMEVLEKANASFTVTDNAIVIQQSALQAFDFDATDCPDLFPPLVALAAYGNGTSTIKGVHRLTHKESNRAATLQEEFGKLNVPVSFEEDKMMIKGGNILKGAAVSSCNDHRIAMATAIAALKADGDVVVNDAQAVNKSYPNFWKDMEKLGANLIIED